MNEPRERISQQMWLPAVNAASETIPAFAVLRVSGINSDGLIQVAKPNTNSDHNLLLNGPFDVPTSKYLSVTVPVAARALYETSDGTPANGEFWGSGNGSFKLRKAQAGVFIWGDADGESVLCTAVTATGILVGRTQGTMTAISSTTPGTGTVEIWKFSSGTLVNTGETETAYNLGPQIPDDTWVPLRREPYSGILYVDLVEICAAKTSGEITARVGDTVGSGTVGLHQLTSGALADTGLTETAYNTGAVIPGSAYSLLVREPVSGSRFIVPPDTYLGVTTSVIAARSGPTAGTGTADIWKLVGNTFSATASSATVYNPTASPIPIGILVTLMRDCVSSKLVVVGPSALLSEWHTDTAAASVVQGDLICGQGASPNTKWSRLSKGAQYQILATIGLEPAWFSQTLLSATHWDTTPATVQRADLITGQGVSPTWARLAKGTADQILSMNAAGEDIVWRSPVPTGSGPPSGAPTNGYYYYDTTNNAYYLWSVTLNAWVLIGQWIAGDSEPKLYPRPSRVAKGTATSEDAGGGITSLTKSGVTTDNGDMLVICVAAFGNASAPNITATYNGTSMTNARDAAAFTAGLTDRVSILNLPINAGVTGNIVVSLSTGCKSVVLVASVWKGLRRRTMVTDGTETNTDTSPDLPAGIDSTGHDGPHAWPAFVITNGPTGDAPGSWVSGWTGGQRDGTSLATATDNMTISEGYRTLSFGESTTFGDIKTGIASRTWLSVPSVWR